MNEAEVRGNEPPDRGAITVALMLLLVVTLAGAALIVDGGRILAARRHASNVAEAAARAGVSTAGPMQVIDERVARAAALDHAMRAGVASSDVTVVVTADRVTVTVVERRTTVFLVLGGLETTTVSAEGTARRAWDG